MLLKPKPLEPKKLGFRTRPSTFPDNSSETIPLLQSAVALDKHATIGVVFLHPKIDKLVLRIRPRFVYDCNESGTQYDVFEKKHAKQLTNRLVSGISGIFFDSISPTHANGQQKTLKAYATHAKTGSKIVFETATDTATTSKNRGTLLVTANPSKLEKDGMAFLWECIRLLTDLTETGIQTLKATPNCIDRIDVCLDMLGVAVEEIRAEYIGDKSDTFRAESISNRKGRQQTRYYIFSKNAGASKIYLYDLKAKALVFKQAGDDPLPYGKVLQTRYECRIETKLSVNNLYKLQNPFTRLDLMTLDWKKLKPYGALGYYFMHYALQRDEKKSLSMSMAETDGFDQDQLSEIYDTCFVPLVTKSELQKIWMAWKNADGWML